MKEIRYMFNIHLWMKELISRLQTAFGPRLVAVGLQGSFKRGEACETSDIDAVVVLDELSPADLTAYKEILASMPKTAHPVCGFISGKEELKNWSRAELFQFVNDTDTLYGSFDGILPAPTRKAALEAAQTGAGTLFHALCHTRVHGEITPGFLAQLYKGAFFALQALHFTRTGEYIPSKRDLFAKLTGDDRAVLQNLLEENFTPAASETLFKWCQKALRETGSGL